MSAKTSVWRSAAVVEWYGEKWAAWEARDDFRRETYLVIAPLGESEESAPRAVIDAAKSALAMGDAADVEPDRLDALEERGYRDLDPRLRVIRGARDYSHRYTIRDGEEDAAISLSRHEISQIAELAGLDLAEPPKPGDARARVEAHARRIHAENELRETELDAIRALEEIEDALANGEDVEELRERITEIRATWVEARLADLYEGYEEEP